VEGKRAKKDIDSDELEAELNEDFYLEDEPSEDVDRSRQRKKLNDEDELSEDLDRPRQRNKPKTESDIKYAGFVQKVQDLLGVDKEDAKRYVRYIKAELIAKQKEKGSDLSGKTPEQDAERVRLMEPLFQDDKKLLASLKSINIEEVKRLEQQRRETSNDKSKLPQKAREEKPKEEKPKRKTKIAKGGYLDSEETLTLSDDEY